MESSTCEPCGLEFDKVMDLIIHVWNVHHMPPSEWYAGFQRPDRAREKQA